MDPGRPRRVDLDLLGSDAPCNSRGATTRRASCSPHRRRHSFSRPAGSRGNGAGAEPAARGSDGGQGDTGSRAPSGSRRALALFERNMRVEGVTRMELGCCAAWTTGNCWRRPNWRAARGVRDRAISTADRTRADTRLQPAVSRAVSRGTRSRGTGAVGGGAVRVRTGASRRAASSPK
jgi:hypothetical protein